ncbi:MAG TPA: ABC transporter permease [Edaphobacter sp.]|nr:ABC transporter permease [Edaphobacter sp.]
MRTMLQDLGYALRQLRKRPGFTVTAILTLTLGIGATTTVFSLVYSVLLRPLPYRDSGRLVAIWEQVKYMGADMPHVAANARHEQYWKQRASSFSDITLLRQNTGGVSQPNEHPRIVGVVRGYTNLFSVLGVQPELGRAFLPEEGTAGHDQVVIITHDLWQRTFASDPHVLGKSLILNGSPLQIVGVLPASFHFPKDNVLTSLRGARGSWPAIGVFVPLIVPESQQSFDGDYNFTALGRLKDGVSLQQATNQLNTIDAAILHDYAAAAKTKVGPGDLRAYIQPLQEAVVGSVSKMLWLLLASVGAVLLIACVNLANLQLARASGREKELSVRAALGATPFRLMSTALYESLLLTISGGIAGILLAQFAIRFFVHHAPVDLPRLDEVGINIWVMGFAVAISALTGIAFGVLPALKALHVDPQAALQQSGNRTAGGHGSSRTRSWLIGTEVFAAIALLMIMGLLDQSLLHLLDEHRGFTTGQVFSAEVHLTGPPYSKDASLSAFDDEILRRLRVLPGVQSAGLVSAMPLTGESWLDSVVRPDRPNGDSEISNYRWISPGYLSTMRIPLLRGRLLGDADRNLKSALISEYTAKTVWPGQDPLGHQFQRGGNGTYTVVGIVADTRSNSLKEQPGLMVYMPYWDNPPNVASFMVRTTGDSASIEETMRHQIWSFDPEANILQVRSLDEQVNESLAPERSQAFVLSSFGIAALLLAVLGIYGVLSYSVSRRVRELGIRIALGATRRNLYVLTMNEAARPVLAGLAGGILASIFAGYGIRSLLYGVSVVDVPVTALAATVFIVAAALAAYFPARRAASVDPVESLRME